MTPDAFREPIRTAERFAVLLAATALGAYLLVLLGATTTLTDAAAACTTWPGCAPPTDPIGQFDLAIAWGHRIGAVVVGGLLLWTAGVAVLGETTRRVRWAIVGAVTLYPLQVTIGALTAIYGPAAMIPGVHLGLGILIFGGLVAALAWHLEAVTGTPEATDDPIKGTEGTMARTEGAMVRSDRRVEATDDPVVSPDLSPEGTLESGAGDASAPARPSVTLPDDHVARWRLRAVAYVRLMKPRLMWLLCLVAAAGMALAAGPDLRPDTVVATLGGGVLAIGAAGTFNHVFERDVDRRMHRTSERPLTLDLVPVSHAVAFGLALTVASVAVFLTVNVLAAALGLAAILFYSVVYTLLLKPNTVQNTVIGGAAGALPALIGWAAVTNEIGVPALALAGLIFLWTPAHFYNLAMAYREDYARGGFPMMPVVRGDTVTRKHVLYYLGATLLSAVVLAGVTELGLLYAAVVVLFGALFLWMALRLHFERTERAAMRCFHASNAFLGATLLVIVLESLLF